jgi:hypothetical protein
MKQVASRALLSLVSCLGYSSTLKMKEMCSIEKSINFIELYGVISQRISLHNQHCENIKNYKALLSLVTCLGYSSTLKMEEMCSIEKSFNFIELHGVISQRISLHNQHCENIKNYKALLSLVSCLGYSSTLKMEEICSIEKSFNFIELRRVISQRISLHNQHCENIKFYKAICIFQSF